MTEEIEQLARTESRPRTSDNAFIPIGVNLWGDAMEHMREISEFAHGGSSVEVRAIGMDSDSNGNASTEVAFWNADERAVELELARLTMQYHREVPGFQSWFDRFEIDTEYDY